MQLQKHGIASLLLATFIYSAAMGIMEATATGFDETAEVHGALADSEDIYRLAFTLSVDLTMVLYPL